MYIVNVYSSSVAIPTSNLQTKNAVHNSVHISIGMTINLIIDEMCWFVILSLAYYPACRDYTNQNNRWCLPDSL